MIFTNINSFNEETSAKVIGNVGNKEVARALEKVNILIYIYIKKQSIAFIIRNRKMKEEIPKHLLLTEHGGK